MRYFEIIREASSFWYVLIKDGIAKAVNDDDFMLVRSMEKDGWQIIWDSARSPEHGYEYALQHYGAHSQESLDNDPYTPKVMTEPKVLYRSVSVPELISIVKTGVITGKQNTFNDFDRRKWVFFGDAINDHLIYQGEEIERQVSVALDKHPLVKEFRGVLKQATDLRAALIPSLMAELDRRNKAYRARGAEEIVLTQDSKDWLEANRVPEQLTWLLRHLPGYDTYRKNLTDVVAKEHALREKLSVARKQMYAKFAKRNEGFTFTSAVLETKPLSGAVHYSKAHGQSGMGGNDEYGFPSGKITLQDITMIRYVKNGKIVGEGLPDDAAKMLRKLKAPKN